jgi:transposase
MMSASTATMATPTSVNTTRTLSDRTKGKSGLTTAEREELARLRKENRELRLERDTLKKATAFFAKESS